jgi:hypothetical protein
MSSGEGSSPEEVCEPFTANRGLCVPARSDVLPDQVEPGGWLGRPTSGTGESLIRFWGKGWFQRGRRICARAGGGLGMLVVSV